MSFTVTRFKSGTEGFFGVELRGGRTEGFLVWNWEGGAELGSLWCETEGVCWTEGFSMWNRGILGAEKVWSLCGTDVLNWGVLGVELRGFRCGTEGGGTDGFLVLNWRILGAEKVWSLCGTDVLNWRGLCGTEGYSINC